MSDTEEGYSLAFSFPDQSPSFTYGFEAGAIFYRMSEGETPIDKGFEEDFPVREENLELYRRMAAYKGYSIETKDAESGWVPMRFTKSMTPRPQLRVVTKES